MNITEAILELRTKFIADGEAPSYFDINNGLCEDFAMDVMKMLGDPDDVMDVCNENFMNTHIGEDTFDWALLEKYWDTVPPKGLTKDEVDLIDFGGHVFLAKDRKFYDCEAPEGVSGLFELPLFKRGIVMALRRKGIPANEVETGDVIPPPECPVPNPVIKNNKSPELGF